MLKIALLGDFSPKEIKTIKSRLNCEIVPSLWSSGKDTTLILAHSSGNSRYYAWNRPFGRTTEWETWANGPNNLLDLVEQYLTSQINGQPLQAAPLDDEGPAPPP